MLRKMVEWNWITDVCVCVCMYIIYFTCMYFVTNKWIKKTEKSCVVDRLKMAYIKIKKGL